MKLPRKWLEEYVDFNVTNEQFVEKMMWRGFEIAEVIDEMPGVSNVVVCEIKSMDKHPNADKLKVCQVDIGEEELLQIVTAATNVFVGAQVPVALDGAHLADGMEIKKTKMRGEASFGMFCGSEELGISEADYKGAGNDGVLILNEKHPNGQKIQEALGLDSVIFDIELTPNRADCQSIIGICREAAAALGQKFKEPEIKKIEGVGNVDDYASVTILNEELCPRYTARVVTDLKIEESPDWLKKKLRSVGMRPINNIVDITNLVLVEYGHPMHAFDLACIDGKKIVVRNAIEGEKVTTLDGKEREVTPDMLLIADAKKGVGIAGVMGGENSEITENTKAVLFESAVFKGSNIRQTTRKLHHVTDAAARFIKGVEPVNAQVALDRAIELVDMLHAGNVIGGTIDVCYANTDKKIINVDWNHVNNITSLELTPEQMVEMLETINIHSKVDGEYLKVEVPHYRVDIEDGIESDWDIAEEIARIYGYYNIKPTLMQGDTLCGKLGENFRDEDDIKDFMVSMGAYEMYNYNFTGPQELDALLIDKDSEKRQNVKILNPFGEEQSLMRTTLVSGMLKSLALNLNKKTGHGRFFELANVHFDNNDTLPEERKMLGIIYSGQNEDFFTMKGSIEQLLNYLGIKGYRFNVGGSEYLQPGQKAVITLGDDVIGEMGTVHPKVLKSFDVPQKAFYAELSFKMLVEHRDMHKTYKAIPKYPVVPRDIAVVVDNDVQSQTLVDVISSTKANGVIIEDVRLFDVYRGIGIPSGMKSMAYSFTLRAEDRTLTDDEIKNAMNSIIKSLKYKANAELRS